MEDQYEYDYGGFTDVSFRVRDPYYNPVHTPRFARPQGVDYALLLRDLCGRSLVLDINRWQIYQPTLDSHVGHDFVCATLSTLWSLGDRRAHLDVEITNGSPKCSGYVDLREHCGKHLFTKSAALLLQLRHRLRLRIVLARSTVISFLSMATQSMTSINCVIDFFVYIPEIGSSLFQEIVLGALSRCYIGRSRRCS